MHCSFRSVLCCTVAFSFALASPQMAEAKQHHDNGWHGGERDHRDDRGRDWRGWDRHDNGRHEGWRWHGRPYHYRPYAWQYVTVYTPPEYVYTNNYREIRCTDSYNPFGFLIGAGLGGLAGSTIGKGHGRTAAIVGGATMGALIGDGVSRQRCSERVFVDAPLGRPISWQAGPQEAYAVVPVREYRDNNQYCREYQSYAMIGGRRSETYGTACLQPDGSWQIVQ